MYQRDGVAVSLSVRMGLERCLCGSPECQRCFPGNHYVECNCAGACECVTDCEGDRCDAKPCSCPKVCRCADGCQCEPPEPPERECDLERDDWRAHV